MSSLERLAELIRARNANEVEIAQITSRPAQIGHLGEFIAGEVFAITLERSASAKALDGWFTAGPFEGRSVNIKWYAKHEGLLDITPAQLPDFYLVMVGPRAASLSSRGMARPWLIESLYLFEAAPLVSSLAGRGIKVGVATSVTRAAWSAAEIYPKPSRRFPLTSDQCRQLALFAPGAA